jgi:hypothetical protein
MTYTLFEWVKENYDDLMADQPDAPIVNTKVHFYSSLLFLFQDKIGT